MSTGDRVGRLGARYASRSATRLPKPRRRSCDESRRWSSSLQRSSQERVISLTEDSRRVAFVTGGSSGIGSGVARTLDDAGWRVVVADINKPAGTDVVAQLKDGLFVELDVTDAGSVAAGVDLALSNVEHVDVLVNCAGTDVVKPFLETDEALWTWLVQLNLLGVFRTTKALLPPMVARGTGRIVNIASDAGRIGTAGEAVYSGCKGGVIAFTKAIAREVARNGITANVVCPGPTDTPPLQKMIDSGGEGFVKALVRGVPLGRIGQPSDVAAAVAFFASDEASFITGQTLSVSGGMTMC